MIISLGLMGVDKVTSHCSLWILHHYDLYPIKERHFSLQKTVWSSNWLESTNLWNIRVIYSDLLEQLHIGDSRIPWCNQHGRR